MEHVHGVDVGWMTPGNPKDKATKAPTRPRSLSQQPREPPAPTASSPALSTTKSHDITSSGPTASPATPKQIPPSRSSFSRSSPSPSEKIGSPTGGGASPQRRNSWFSNLSSKFSSNAGGNSPPQANHTPPKQAEISTPKANPIRNAVLQHAAKYEGDGPYTPAPPKSTPAGLLQVFRRLSTTTNLVPGIKGNNHGLVERRVLNVNHRRERCLISDLNQSKLRRVAFCVDVEVAPLPKYASADGLCGTTCAKDDKTQKRKVAERGEGEALKHPNALAELKEDEVEAKANGEALPTEGEIAGVKFREVTPIIETDGPSPEPLPPQKPLDTKKKDKKKKSEEERKARKEKKRRLAEANGMIPMEIHLDSDSDSESSSPIADVPRAQHIPTTNPARIYRRCCQLRETPILKKITEQLMNTANFSSESGMVEKLDLTGYWMQLADLVTLGDYLAVVPIREVILENCGLTDEGLRVVLAGILAAKKLETRKRKRATEPDSPSREGGVVERLVLKSNKLGPEGWRHLCLFIYLCRSLKFLDLSGIPFPQLPKRTGAHTFHANGAPNHPDLCQVFAKSLGVRLGGSTLSLLNLSETGLSTEQLSSVLDGIIECGVKRLGLAHNNIDAQGVQQIAKYLRSGKCEGLDLGGNDMRDQLEVLADSVTDSGLFGALSLAECNLVPSSLYKSLPKLLKIQSFRFIDLSHNHDLFNSNPSAISVLRRYLPKFTALKRIHLADCSMSSEQAIALAEILPEITGLAHISFMQNPEIARLTDAKTEESQEEACALFASLLAATRLSTSIVCVDIEVPSEQSSDLVKAMAKQVVAYCLRNMERLPVSQLAAATLAQTEASAKHDSEYPVVLQHLVGHDVDGPSELDVDVDAAPDDHYVIGGTGVVKALTCCLKNRGDESRRQSGEFVRELEAGTPLPTPKVSPGRAKDMSKHLLSSARKIRLRLQPAIVKAKGATGEDANTYHRLLFLDNTLKGIIKRFEDEYPETRESADSAVSMSPEPQPSQVLGSSPSSTDADFPPAVMSDGEDEPDFNTRPPPLSRSSSIISTTSKALADEEGRVLRAGHKFRTGIVKPEPCVPSPGVEMVSADPNHARVLHEMLVELGDEDLLQKAEEMGAAHVFHEDKDQVLRRLREADPEHWERFAESQEMARKNVKVDDEKCGKPSVEGVAAGDKGVDQGNEEAVVVE